VAPTCFGLRPSSGSLQLSLAKVMSILKHLVGLHRNLLCGGVAACPSMMCVLCAVQSTAHSTRHTGTCCRAQHTQYTRHTGTCCRVQHTIHTPYWDMLQSTAHNIHAILGHAAEHSTQYTRHTGTCCRAQHTIHKPYWDMLQSTAHNTRAMLAHGATPPHNKLRCNLTECFNINITLARLSCKLPGDSRIRKHVGAT
jgi:hypothetical protein